MAMDQLLLHLLNRPGNPVLDAAMIALSARWLLLLLLALASLALWVRSRARWRGVLLLCAAVGLADLSSARLLKPTVARLRPCAETPPRSLAFDGCGRGRSFPSSHAANAAAAATVLIALGAPAVVAPAAGLAVLVGASRVYLGVHYPSDVLAGWILGIALGIGLLALARRWLPGRAAESPSSLSPEGAQDSSPG